MMKYTPSRWFGAQQTGQALANGHDTR
jgi:hypothetical protein